MHIIDRIIQKCHLSENKEKIVRNLFWAVLGKTVTLLGSLFVGIIIARYLGPEQYGLMNYVIYSKFLHCSDSIILRSERRPATMKSITLLWEQPLESSCF